MMENALRTFIALPGQIYIFNVHVYILFLKRKTKTTKVYNTSGNRTNKQRNKKKKPNAFPHSLFPLLLVLTGRCLDHGEGAHGTKIVSTPLAPAKGSHLCTCWWRIQLSRLGLKLFFKFTLDVCVCIGVCVCVYTHIHVHVCACVCVFIHTYINIYIYVLKWISFPSGRKLRGTYMHQVHWAGRKAHCYCNVPARLGTGQAEASSDLSLSCYPFLSLCTNPLSAQLPCRR